MLDYKEAESLLSQIGSKIKSGAIHGLNFATKALEKSKEVREFDERILNVLFNSLCAISIEITQEGISLDRFIGMYTNYLEFLTHLEKDEFYGKNLDEILKKICNMIYGYDDEIYNSALEFYQNSNENSFAPLLKKHENLRAKGAIFKKCKSFL